MVPITFVIYLSHLPYLKDKHYLLLHRALVAHAKHNCVSSSSVIFCSGYIEHIHEHSPQRARLGSHKTGLTPKYFYTDRSKAVLLLWFLTVTCSCCPYLYFGSAIM